MAEKHLIRIADWGVTEQTVIFADDFVLDRLPAGGDVLDIGCGRGVFDAKAAQRVRTVTGIDITPAEIDAALAMRQDDNISFVVHDAEKLSELSGSYDAAFSRFCFHHLDMEKTAAGIHNRLKPGGRLIAIDCLEDYWKLSGSFYILRDATRRLGIMRMTSLLPRLLFFFTPKRFQHVKSDIARIKREKRYHFDDFKHFYTQLFPGAQVGMIGCAAYIDWRKPLA